MDNKKLEVPQSDIKDVAHTGVTVALSAIPFLGLGELFKATIAPPIEKRRDEWMQVAGEAIEEVMKRKQISVEDVIADEEFISLLTDASRIAAGTHLEEKILALKNALVNSTLPEANYNNSAYFLKLIDRLAPAQMRIMQHVSDFGMGNQQPAERGMTPRDLFFSNLSRIFRNPERMSEPVIMLPALEAYLNELVQLGLIQIIPANIPGKEMPGRETPYCMVSVFGSGFYRFIQE